MEDGEGRATQEDGSEPVKEHPQETPGPGRSVMQIVVIVIGVLVLLAALLWLILPFGAS